MGLDKKIMILYLSLSLMTVWLGYKSQIFDFSAILFSYQEVDSLWFNADRKANRDQFRYFVDQSFNETAIKRGNKEIDRSTPKIHT